MTFDSTDLSKFLSYVLRHKPDSIGLSLDSQGWALIDELIERSNIHGTKFNRADLLMVVESNDKKRFFVSNDGQRIRAAQGHSIEVDLGLPPLEPPHVLYHGTATRFMHSILTEGLKSQSRTHVHLSSDEATAYRIGQRYGKPVILRIDAHRMYLEDFRFYLADNKVWLTNHVPAEFLTPMSSSTAD